MAQLPYLRKENLQPCKQEKKQFVPPECTPCQTMATLPAPTQTVMLPQSFLRACQYQYNATGQKWGGRREIYYIHR